MSSTPYLEFQDYPSTSTPLSATNLNNMQVAIADVVNENTDNIGDMTTLTTTDKTSLVNAINETNDKAAIVVTMSSNQTAVNSSGAEVLLNFNTITAQVGDGFTFNSSRHEITVGPGISYVEVSGSLLCSNISGTGLRRLIIKVNNTVVARGAVQYDISFQGHIEVSPRIVPVEEGDVITACITMQGTNAVAYASNIDTYINIKKYQ